MTLMNRLYARDIHRFEIDGVDYLPALRDVSISTLNAESMQVEASLLVETESPFTGHEMMKVGSDYPKTHHILIQTSKEPGGTVYEGDMAVDADHYIGLDERDMHNAIIEALTPIARKLLSEEEMSHFRNFRGGQRMTLSMLGKMSARAVGEV